MPGRSARTARSARPRWQTQDGRSGADGISSGRRPSHPRLRLRIAGMRIGGKRRIFIPWQLAYGSALAGPAPTRPVDSAQVGPHLRRRADRCEGYASADSAARCIAGRRARGLRHAAWLGLSDESSASYAVNSGRRSRTRAASRACCNSGCDAAVIGARNDGSSGNTRNSATEIARLLPSAFPQAGGSLSFSFLRHCRGQLRCCCRQLPRAGLARLRG